MRNVLSERLINRLQSVGWRLNRDEIAQVRESQIRPWPIGGVLNRSRSNRITKNIANSCAELAILLDGETLEPPLPHMALASIMVVIPPDVLGIHY